MNSFLNLIYLVSLLLAAKFKERVYCEVLLQVYESSSSIAIPLERHLEAKSASSGSFLYVDCCLG
jgi:hypothetical protein